MFSFATFRNSARFVNFCTLNDHWIAKGLLYHCCTFLLTFLKLHSVVWTDTSKLLVKFGRPMQDIVVTIVLKKHRSLKAPFSSETYNSGYCNQVNLYECPRRLWLILFALWNQVEKYPLYYLHNKAYSLRLLRFTFSIKLMEPFYRDRQGSIYTIAFTNIKGFDILKSPTTDAQ